MAQRIDQNSFPIKLASASCNQTGGDWPRNLANICAAIDQAAADGADILGLEELGLTGYERGDDFFYSDNDLILQMLRIIARYAAAKAPDLVISVGHPWYFSDKHLPAQADRRKNPLFNRVNNCFDAQSFLAHGDIAAISAKRYLFNYERGYEKRHFEEWSEEAANSYENKYGKGRHGTIVIELPETALPDGTNMPEKTVPFGAPVIRIGAGDKTAQLTHIICEEYWIGSRFDGTGDNDDYGQDNPLAQKARYFDITVALNPNASPPAPEKIDKHRELCKLASRHCEVLVHTDGLGSSGSTFAQFGSRLMAQDGEIISEGKRASFLDMAYTSQIVTVRAPRNKGHAPHLSIPHQFKTDHSPAIQDGPAAWEYGERAEFEEEMRNELLWLFDYMRKNRIQGIAQALSGGADSGYNAAKLRLMIELAVAERGIDGFLDAMPHLTCADKIRAAFKTGGDAAAIDCAADEMLTCVYMGTDNSSEDTLRAAQTLVEGGTDENGDTFKGIGGKFENRNVQNLLEQYCQIYAGMDSLSLFAKNPVAYENVQARARQVLIMTFANTENKLAISNPNLDEGRNSYATWGGDLHGGMISGNAHKNKARQLEHMRLLYEYGLEGAAAPVKSLFWILKNKPSAELQPRGADGKVTQFDEDQLGRSFVQMDVISHFMLNDRPDNQHGRKNSPREVFEKCRSHPAFVSDDIATLHDRIRLSYEKWGHAQFKIHGSPIAATYGKNVDHQSSLRTPNISANHRPELAVLALYVLEELAKADGTSLETISGETLTALHGRALFDTGFAEALAAKMWTPDATDGLKMKIATLYAHLKTDGTALLSTGDAKKVTPQEQKAKA
ncbi:MAG: hypothetical protein HND56_10030 [Pseudomonadota bacterium]|nr:hypothetical protein [Pseudomonadota bacterium]QKK06006.1 MAG: hypothetical protein HND56_10030 [Pseudomonadota bacterium]